MWCLTSLLPQEVVDVVGRHAAAMVMQLRWRRFWRYGHARRGERWARVRDHLRLVGAWPSLAAYSHVRREWRTEPESWLLVDDADVCAIEREAREARLWGVPSVFFPDHTT